MERTGKCCLCGDGYDHYGHNPAPLGDLETERCCEDCNNFYVLPARGVGKIDVDSAPINVLRRYIKLQQKKTN